MPQNVTANQRIDSTGSCIILIGWNPPPSVAEDDISHYQVYVNDTNNFKENLTLTAYPVGTCGSHTVRVAAVNRCDRVGQNSSITTLDQDPFPLLTRESVVLTTQPTSPDDNSNNNCKKIEGKNVGSMGSMLM